MRGQRTVIPGRKGICIIKGILGHEGTFHDHIFQRSKTRNDLCLPFMSTGKEFIGKVVGHTGGHLQRR